MSCVLDSAEAAVSDGSSVQSVQLQFCSRTLQRVHGACGGVERDRSAAQLHHGEHAVRLRPGQIQGEGGLQQQKAFFLSVIFRSF